MPDHLYHVRCANSRSELPANNYLTEDNDSADMHYAPEMAEYAQEEVEKIVQECAEAGQQTPSEHELVLSREESDARAYSIVHQHYLVNKKTVVERDTDLLTRMSWCSTEKKWQQQYLQNSKLGQSSNASADGERRQHEILSTASG